jgi:hypothetical protein
MSNKQYQSKPQPWIAITSTIASSSRHLSSQQTHSCTGAAKQVLVFSCCRWQVATALATAARRQLLMLLEICISSMDSISLQTFPAVRLIGLINYPSYPAAAAAAPHPA